MADYDVYIKLDFQGTDSETEKLIELLKLMDKEEHVSDDVFENTPYVFDDIWENALLGILNKKGDKEFSWYVPGYQSGLHYAPQLIAVLFPNASFSYEAYVGDSVSTEDDKFYNAEYHKQKFVEETYDGLDIENAIDVLENDGDDELSKEKMQEVIKTIKQNSRRTVIPVRDALYEKSFCGEKSLDELLKLKEQT